jgi:methyl-accepting chemotaxis protein
VKALSAQTRDAAETIQQKIAAIQADAKEFSKAISGTEAVVGKMQEFQEMIRTILNESA